MPRFITIIISAIVMLSACLSAFLLCDYRNSLDKAVLISGGKIFSIEQGSKVKEIASRLYREGLIASPLYFQIYSWQQGWQSAYQAGEYKFEGRITMRDAAYQIASGSGINMEFEVLIREGETVADIAKKFAELGMFAENDFLSAAGFPRIEYRTAQNYPALQDYSSKYGFLADKPKHYGYEGYLFPDTYRFFKNSTPDGVMLKMLDNFEKKITEELKNEIRRQGKTIHEIVTMASLLEKEVRTEDDMRIAAGIFWDRIRIGQPLQSCATLAYVLGVQKAQYSVADTNAESPYNTYRNQGLPPGPINNPGLKAIRAAIYPTYTEYNYFLSAPDGTTVFSKTFDEHVRNKEKYLK